MVLTSAFSRQVPVPDNSIGLLRYLLALSIVAHHANVLGGAELPVLIDARTTVSVFFALSGYFAWTSWQRRRSAGGFVLRRLRRLLPAYWAVVVLSAVGLAAVSALSLPDYFASPQWWRYLVFNLCLLNFLEPELPGVFASLPHSMVNGALWYVKVEIGLTFLLPLLQALSAGGARLGFRGRKYITPGRLALAFWGVLTLALALCATRPEGAYTVGARYLGYVQMFLAGAAFHAGFAWLGRWRVVVPLLVAAGVMKGVWPPLVEAAGACFLPLFLIFLFSAKGWFRVLNRHNMAYSLYLCHCPLIQLGLVLRPGWEGVCFGLLLTACVTPLLYFGVERRKANAAVPNFFHHNNKPGI